MKEAMETKLIATYQRVSTSAQEEQQTIQTQILTLKEFAKKNNYRIAQEYIDDGWSGDTLIRPALDELRQDAKKKIWDAILIYDPDRLARRYSYQELVMDELREAGIEVIFVTVSAPKNPEDKILHGVRGLFAEYERAKISERFRLGKLRKVKEGHVLTTEAPYGYTYIRGDKEKKMHGYYQINQEEADVVKMIFTWVAKEGLTTRGIVRRLQELHIKPRKSKRGVWNTSTLCTLLKHKAYIGEAYWGKHYAVVPENPIKIEKYKRTRKSSRKIRPEEEWYKIPVPPLIDKELFFQARQQIENNGLMSSRNKKNQYLLSGRIYCTCGIKRHGEGPQHGKHLYYRCSDRIYSFPLKPKCLEKGFNARIADELVWNKITELMSSPKLMHEQTNRWLKARKFRIKSTIGDIKDIEKQIAKLKSEEERYSKAYGAGVFTIDQLKEYTVPIRDRITMLESQVMKAEREKSEINGAQLPTKLEVRKYSTKAAKILGNLNFEQKRAIMMNVLDKIVGTQEKLDVSGFLPITPNHVELKIGHRHRGVAERREIHPLQGSHEKTN